MSVPVYVACCVLLRAKVLSCFTRSSAINPSKWRAQKIVVKSVNQEDPLSSFHLQTGLSMAPLRTLPSPFIPRLSSLAFHPKEMLYGLGQPDGTSVWFFFLLELVDGFF